MNDLKKLSEERHNAAREIVQSGRPFVLLLRTYAKTMPWARNLQNEVHDELSPELAVLSIRGDHPLADAEERHTDLQLRARCPALTVAKEDWQTVARELVVRAAFIICEVWDDTPGMSLELSMCREQHRTDDTVVLLPRPGADQLNRYETFDGFWRLALFRDLGGRSLFTHPAARSLPIYGKPVELKSRRGIPFIIPELISLADLYLAESNDWGHASVHAQNAWNLGVRLAEFNAPTSLAERDGIVNAACMLAHRLAQFNRLADARDKLDVAAMLCAESELQYHMPRLAEMKRRLNSLIE
ncbi:MAG TPA: hypothetical protein VFZ44_16285, partial [Pyrinomonadaceae bacterium]